MTFDFSVPITWADISNVISTVVALGAVIVAIVANCKASQSLKYSLKMQEQSKNIDLFEKRVAVIDEINKNTKTSKLHLELLFNEAIAQKYKVMLECWGDLDDAYHDLNVYSDAIHDVDGEGGYTSFMAELEDTERLLEEQGYPADKVRDFEALCAQFQISYSESGDVEDIKVYNYKEISERITSTTHQLEDQKKALLDLMQSFVKDSIMPIDKIDRKQK